MKIKSLYKIFLLLAAVLLPGAIVAKNPTGKTFTLVVDPGHGGKDFGAVDNGTREKDINLGVALQLEALMNKKLKEAKTVMTRDKDVYLTLQERADIANKAKGDLFISIHTNSVDKKNKNRKNISGSSVYALGLHKDDNNMTVARRENSVIELESNFEQKYSGFDPSKDESYIIFEMAQKKNLSKSIRFAEMAQKQLTKSGRANRGVHQAGFWVLWATSMPSVLVELDFICNPVAAKYLDSEKGHKELAEAIFKAVEAYYSDWQQMQANTNMTRSMAQAAKTASEDKQQELAADNSDASSWRVKVGPKSAVKREDKAPTASTSRQTDGRRRRRSDAAKEASSSRSVETDAIPLHSSADRVGETVVAEEVVEEVIVPQNDSASKKDKKQKEKKEKKNKEKKEKESKKRKDRPSDSHNAKVEKFVTVYKVQVLASADLLKQGNPRFHGLSPITTYKENNLYKYYYGETESQGEIEEILKEVKKKIPDAFVVTSKKVKSASKK